MCWPALIINPFFAGFLAGVLTANPGLALTATGFTLLFWKEKQGAIFIIVGTVLLVYLTGNINFELIFIFYITLAMATRKIYKGNFRASGLILSLIWTASILMTPGWRWLLALLPVQVLNYINISGQSLLAGGLIVNVLQLESNGGLPGAIHPKSPAPVGVYYTVLTIISCLCIIGSGFVNPLYINFIWLAGVFCYWFLESDLRIYRRIPLKLKKVGNWFIYVLSGISGYFLLPQNWLLPVCIVIITVYYFCWQERPGLLEMVYLSLIVGIVGGSLGLLS